MQALHFDKTLQLISEYPQPEPGQGEALIRVTKAGICNTDLELVKGYMGFSGVLGHEFVGVVETGDHAGQRVAGEINLNCRQCDTCQRGRPTQCPHRVTLGIDRKDGAFAEYLTLPEHLLHRIPDSVSDDQAVFVEPLAAALQTTHMTKISSHDRVALIGAGKLGLLTAQVLALTGCDLSVIARHQNQFALLDEWGIPSGTRNEIDDKSVDIVVDCTGSVDGFNDALDLVRPQGIIHLKSTYHGLPEANLTRVVVDEIQIHSSRCGPFDSAIRLLERGLVDVESLISGRFLLGDGIKAMETAGEKGTLKVLLEIG